jgi:hypothetical protein
VNAGGGWQYHSPHRKLAPSGHSGHALYRHRHQPNQPSPAEDTTTILASCAVGSWRAPAEAVQEEGIASDGVEARRGVAFLAPQLSHEAVHFAGGTAAAAPRHAPELPATLPPLHRRCRSGRPHFLFILSFILFLIFFIFFIFAIPGKVVLFLHFLLFFVIFKFFII